MIEQQRPSGRVTLEDLLRLKRSERPPTQFWVEFERSLREKQLAAIVEKRPWWRSWAGLARWSIPLGAAAALSVTIATVTHGRRNPSVQVADAAKVVVPTPIVAVSEPPATVTTPAESISAVADIAPRIADVISSPPSQIQEAPAPVMVASSQDSARAITSSVSEQVALLTATSSRDQEPEGSFASVSERPSSAFEGLTTYFDRVVARLDSAGLRSSKSASVEPLTQVPTPRDARRARLLAFTSSVDTHSPQYSDNTNVIRSRERITSHLNEEALYDSIRRLGIKNGGVSIQF